MSKCRATLSLNFSTATKTTQWLLQSYLRIANDYTTTIPPYFAVAKPSKVERSSRVDRNSLATLPPILRSGQAPNDWGPSN